MNDNFDVLLEESVRVHGHLCAGQVLGVRMSLLGLDRIGINDPKGADRKQLMVFVEMDRCATDAVQSVTGCSLGKRTMKFLDYGKMAATFLNLRTGRAARIVAREEAREGARMHAPDAADKYAAQLQAYRVMDDYALFSIEEVRVGIRPEDVPGRPLRRVACERCGEQVQDMREVVMDGRTLCIPCAKGGYYTKASDRSAESVMQNEHNGYEIRSKIWIETGGEPVFGRGRRLLLQAIDDHGSINRAAQEVGISFRKAWSHIAAMEERLGIKLVDRQAGGRNGGGAALTREARGFLEKYELMEQGIREIVDERFHQVFGGNGHV